MIGYRRIPHLWGSKVSRGDLWLTDVETRAALRGRVVVYEKLDGLNVGFGFRRPGQLRVEVRGVDEFNVTDLTGELWRLSTWAQRRLPRLWAALGTERWVFGEWLEPVVGVRYRALRDWCVFFDLYDRRRRRYIDKRLASAELASYGLPTNRPLYCGALPSVSELRRFPRRSQLGAPMSEGFVIECQSGVYKFVRQGHRRLTARQAGGARNNLSATAAERVVPLPV